MEQLAIDFAAPSVATARAMGEIGAGLAAGRAERDEPGFVDRAAAFVLAYLERVERASGEDITDAAKLAGIRPPDDRAFGAVYARLSRRGLIACAGYCARRRGNGTAGGRIWRRVVR